MRIAYLTTTYPAVSHTFIRRELNELERMMGEISRFAIRPSPFDIVDSDDLREDSKTFRVLTQPTSRWASALLRQGLRHPIKAAKGLRAAFQLGFRSDRGMLRHAIYFFEALLLLDEMKIRRIEHLHVHFGTNPTSVAQIVRVMGGPPYSFTVHGPQEFDAPIGFSLERKIISCSFVVAISSYGGAQLRRWVAPQYWDKIRVVRCGVGDEFFQQATPIDPNSKTLVCVGRLSAQKGQILLVDGFAKALDQGVDANLVLAGDGEMRDSIEALVRERGLSERVRITGWISGQQVRRELLVSRALILPSFAEGLPVVIVEAFALGRPVLTTCIAGIPELVIDKENGWLFEAGSVNAIVRAIKEVMSASLPQLQEMADRGRKAVRKYHFTPTETVKLADYIRQSGQCDQDTGSSGSTVAH